MPDVKRVVETQMKVADMATAPLKSIGSAAQNAGQLLMSMAGPLTALAGGAGIGALASSAVRLNSQFENTQNNLAGIMGALGLVAGNNPLERFNNGLREADSVMEQISAAAAALPGEAQDYIDVFQAGLTNVSQAMPRATMTEMVAFTNRMTAVTTSFGIAAQQAGSDLARMTAASASGLSENVTLRQMLPYLRQLEGQANITATSFAAMTAPRRIELMQQSFALLQPMIDHAGNSWDAMTGGFASATQMIFRMASVPLFDAAKDVLHDINSLLMDSNGHLTEQAQQVVTIGKMIATYLVSGFSRALELAKQLGTAMLAIGRNIMRAPWMQGMMNFVNRVAAVGARLGAMAGGSRGHAGQTAVAGIAGRMALGPAGAALGAMAAFATHTNEVNLVLMRLSSIGSLLVTGILPMVELFGFANEQVGALMAAVLPGVMSALESLVGPVMEVIGWFGQLYTTLATRLMPHLLNLWTAIGSLVGALGSFLGPVIRIVGAVFMSMVRVVSAFVIPVVTRLYDALAWFIRGVAGLLRFLGRAAGSVADLTVGPAPGAAPAAEMDIFASIRGAIEEGTRSAENRDAAHQAAARAASRAAPHQRGGHGTHNDFRNSRFSIQQRFAEGFDPDRVAVAFSRDLERTANQRLQSGFEPVFGVN